MYIGHIYKYTHTYIFSYRQSGSLAWSMVSNPNPMALVRFGVRVIVRVKGYLIYFKAILVNHVSNQIILYTSIHSHIHTAYTYTYTYTIVKSTPSHDP